MKYNSLKVAARIAKFCLDNSMKYNNTKIQKLLYCCYGCTLVELNDRICDEYPRAWQYGPVFPRVFNYINKKNDLTIIDHSEISDKPAKLIKDVVEAFGYYTAQSLSEWSHSKDSPWDTVVNQIPKDEGGGLGNFIPDDIIKLYFDKNIIEA